jgi:SAM-dependent methyltransferase
MTEGSLAFDRTAAEYDATFTRSTLGAIMRRAVWRRLDVCFRRGDHVLEINCGTGEDAVYLARRGVRVLASDASSSMISVAREKIEVAGVGEMVETLPMAIEDLESSDVTQGWAFDGMLSNFGGLNCVSDLEAVAREAAGWLRPGARVVLCLMGPWVPWEWGWYLWRGEPRRAFRRLRPGGTNWRGLTIRYPSVRGVRRAFAPGFAVHRVAALGALLPPSYVEEWAVRHRALVERLDRWERRLELWSPLVWLADHYVMELVRR